jgi:type IV pilus assembly protein PilC
MEFAFEAMNREGRMVRDRVEAEDRIQAADALRSRDMLVLRLERARNDLEEAAAGGAPPLLAWLTDRRPALRDLVLFTRQMKMLLEAGAPLVPALQAIELQTQKASFRRTLRDVRQRVERGHTLTEALREHGQLFSPVFCSVVAAGEATAALPEAFNRLSHLAHRQQQTRRSIAGATVYPALLMLLLIGVLAVLLGFVIPRFAVLFENLNQELPPVTRALLTVSEAAREHWAVLLGGLSAFAAAVVILVRHVAVRTSFDETLLRLPMLGPVVRRLQLARVLRVWAALLRSHVPLLETLEHSRTTAGSAVFRRLIERVEENVAGGGRVGRALADSGLVEPVLASAISTGEENGRLAEAVEFVSNWLDEENAQLVQQLTRAAEPVLLACMGLIVGGVALALFVPLFDVATAGGG